MKPLIIDEFSKGIINFHPGLIPECRGLDALQWSIFNDVDLGVTSHLIDRKVDAGRLIEIKQIALFKDDTLLDLSERLYETQLEMLNSSLKLVLSEQLIEIDYDGTAYNRKMSSSLELTIPELLPSYLDKRIK